MRIVFFSTKHFSFSMENLEKIRSVAGSEVVQADEKGLEESIRSADVLITNNCSIDPVWFERAEKLKYVHALSAGVDNILKTLPEKIPLANSSGVHGTNMAEHVLGFMIMHERKLDESLKAQSRREWKVFSGHDLPGELFGKTAAVFGLGKIGERTAEVCSALGMRVLGVARTVRKSRFAEKVFSSDDCDYALKEADYVICAMPGTEETRHFFSRARFEMMKPGSFFINVGRGSQVNEKDLAECIRRKIIAGAGLDVFEEEPLPESSELWGLDNVIITPHSAGFTPRYMDRFTDIFCENLKCFIEGKPLPNNVEKKRGY